MRLASSSSNRMVLEDCTSLRNSRARAWLGLAASNRRRQRVASPYWPASSNSTDMFNSALAYTAEDSGELPCSGRLRHSRYRSIAKVSSP